jgi:hypothetical protein
MKARRACCLGLADPAGQDKDAAHVGGHVEGAGCAPATQHYYEAPKATTQSSRQAGRRARESTGERTANSVPFLLPLLLPCNQPWTVKPLGLAIKRAVQQAERPRQAAPSVADAPGAQGQQAGGSKTVKDNNAPGARPKTVKDQTRDKSVSRALGPDVVDDKGQRFLPCNATNRGPSNLSGLLAYNTAGDCGKVNVPFFPFWCKSDELTFAQSAWMIVTSNGLSLVRATQRAQPCRCLSRSCLLPPARSRHAKRGPGHVARR